MTAWLSTQRALDYKVAEAHDLGHNRGLEVGFNLGAELALTWARDHLDLSNEQRDLLLDKLARIEELR